MMVLAMDNKPLPEFLADAHQTFPELYPVFSGSLYSVPRLRSSSRHDNKHLPVLVENLESSEA